MSIQFQFECLACVILYTSLTLDAKQIPSTVRIFKPPLIISSVMVVLETSSRLPFQRKSFTIDVISSRYLFGISRASIVWDSRVNVSFYKQYFTLHRYITWFPYLEAWFNLIYFVSPDVIDIYIVPVIYT